MKKLQLFLIFLSLSVTWFANESLAQGQSNAGQGFANSQMRQSYMMRTYGITSQQASDYDALLKNMKSQRAVVKGKAITAKEYHEQMRAIQGQFNRAVSQLFSSNQYSSWNECVKSIERYRYWSEDELIDKAKILQLIDAEADWWDTRKEMWASAIDESLKHKEDAAMLIALQTKICSIFGQQAGERYFEGKTIDNYSATNMDKYKCNYNAAERIAQIEIKYKKRRQGILDVKRAKWADTEELLAKNDTDKYNEIKSSVPKDVAGRWVAINNSHMDYDLKKSYGLSADQIAKYKNTFNKYIIEEFLVIYKQNLSHAEMLAKLKEADAKFCQEVKALFSAESYQKWQGRRQYDFERRMKLKGITK